MHKMMPVDQTHCELSVYIMGIIWCKYGKKSFKLITPEPHFFIYPTPPQGKHSIEMCCGNWKKSQQKKNKKQKKHVTEFLYPLGGSGEVFWDA